MRTISFMIAGFLLLTGVAELEAQARDTTSTRAGALPGLLKVKATLSRDALVPPAIRSGNVASNPVVPPPATWARSPCLSRVSTQKRDDALTPALDGSFDAFRV